MTKNERRKNKRFKAASGAYAVVGPDVSKIGQIKDISLGGLAFKYLADEAKSNESNELDIIVRKGNLYVRKIRIRTVSDFELAKEDPYSTITLRQQGVQFDELTSDQAYQLKFMIENYTSETEMRMMEGP